MDWERKTAQRAALREAAADTFNDMITPGQSLLKTLQVTHSLAFGASQHVSDGTVSPHITEPLHHRARRSEQESEVVRKDKYFSTVGAKMKAAREKLPSLGVKHAVRSDMSIFTTPPTAEVHSLLPVVQPAQVRAGPA